MPVVQFDFCYFKTAVEPTTTAILTGIDVETGMAMATMVGDKQQDQYHVNCIQSFFMKCGRVQAVLSSTILQSDQGDDLIALLQTAASKMGGKITTTQSPAYSSQARVSGWDIRTLRAQLQQNYNRTITSKHYNRTIASKHAIVPWLVKHIAYLLNRYATHADGNTSYFRRWNKDRRAFGETVQYLYPQSNNYQRRNSDSSDAFGLEEIQQQEQHSWASATKLSEEAQSDACPSQTSMTDKCLMSSAEPDIPWHHHQHHKHSYKHRWSSIHPEDQQQPKTRKHLWNKHQRCQHRQKVDHNFPQEKLRTHKWQAQDRHWPVHQWPQHQQVVTADPHCHHQQSDTWQIT